LSAFRRSGHHVSRHQMPSVAVRIVLLALLAHLTACAPWPHVEYTRPSVLGRLVEDGKPIAGAEVFLGAKPATNDPCSEAGDRVAVSAIDGSFHISERSNTVLMLSLLNPPSVTGMITAICVRRAQTDNGIQIGALLITFIDKPTSVSIDCDISKKRERNDMGNAQVSSPLGQPQLCRAIRVPRDAS
jgi:hypothetical protein